MSNYELGILAYLAIPCSMLKIKSNKEVGKGNFGTRYMTCYQNPIVIVYVAIISILYSSVVSDKCRNFFLFSLIADARH